MWQNETEEVRAHFKTLAENEKLAHSLRFPDYQYKPRKASEKKRRMSKKIIANFSALRGAWNQERSGDFPGNEDLFACIEHHNHQHKHAEVGLLTFEQSPAYDEELYNDLQDIPFGELLEQN